MAQAKTPTMIGEQADAKIREKALARAKDIFGEKSGAITNTFAFHSVKGDKAIVLVNGGPQRITLTEPK